MEHRSVLLIILDGWGINSDKKGNAVFHADTPYLDSLFNAYSHTRLTCSGEAVGLPAGIMGNSEVGHLNIGAGRIVYQDLLRIDNAIQDGSFFVNDALNRVMDRVKTNGSTLHLMGLVSDGGVHSQLTHLKALVDMAESKGLDRVRVHAILDGRDTPPDGGLGYIRDVHDHIKGNDRAKIASICGRFYAMDRDKRWDRIQMAYRLYTAGRGVVENDPEEAIRNAYQRGETDEFVKPISLRENQQSPADIVQHNDGIVFFNFRADRAREITSAFTDPGFAGFDPIDRPKVCDYVCMTLYDETFTLPVAFPPVHLDNILGETLSKHRIRQLRIAETEKYAHVTYFFNGGEETPFPLEDRCLVPSPREVATYDLKPEMSAFQVTEELLSRIGNGTYGFIVLNFANMDMVGHSGVMKAAVQAVATVDRCLEKIVTRWKAQGHVALVTADHGNAEMMIDHGGNPHTAHTTHRVPFILIDDDRKNVRLKEGVLGDIAPTILQIMTMDQPAEMTGNSLLD